MKLFATPALLVGAMLAGSLLAQEAAAQCATCPQPTLALSPVAPAPVVQPTVALSPVAVQQPVALQTYQPTRRLFTGYWLRRLFGYRDTVVAAPVAPVAAPPTFVTAAYQPTYPLTAGLLTPQVQTVARPVALATTSYRAVTMSPVACCPTDCCSSCGVQQAGFAAPACPSCSGGGSTFGQPTPYQPAPYQPTTPTPAGETPRPGLDPEASILEQRRRPTPGDDRSYLDPNDIGPASPASPPAGSGSRETFSAPSDTDAYYQAPQLFNPNNRTTRRPAAPVWNAVYQRTANSGPVYRVGPDAAPASYSAPRREQQGASGWRSVRD